MQATHWRITARQPDGWKCPKNKQWWQLRIPSQLTEVWRGKKVEATYTTTSLVAATKYQKQAIDEGLECTDPKPYAFVELTPEMMLDQGLEIPAEQEWDVVTARYARDWWPEHGTQTSG